MTEKILQDNSTKVAHVLSGETPTKQQMYQLHLSNDRSPMGNTKVYRRRWLMLLIFVLVFMTNAFQWIQFTIINNLIMK
jgi:FLVCR family feline leukemia virus subgroup C receptor-related protein